MATFYIDPDYGPGGDGSESTPFDSWADVTWTAGNSYLQKRGTTAVENVTVGQTGTAANPITLGAYGSGANPIIRPATEGSVGLLITSRSYVTVENIDVVGLSSWTSANTIGVRINGSGSGITLNSVDVSYCGIGIDLVGGFAFSNVEITDCSATDCRVDGVRCWSGTGTYTWNGVRISGGEFSRNGVAQGSNGHGINFQVQDGHTGSTFQNIEIKNATIADNYRAGIALADNSVAFSTLIASGNTTPPTRQYKTININSNVVQSNGGAGISVLGADGGSINRNYVAGNSSRTTLGNIWTSCSRGIVVAFNECYRASSNGTVTGDGVGIFDDQWNDGCKFIGNYIADNIFQESNPEYTAYGIGIYRSTGGKHIGNVIVNCRYGFVIGYVSGATAPTMANVLVANNTIIDSTVQAIKIWVDTPASALRISNNAISGADQPMSADDATAGNQTFENNVADRCTNETDGSNITNGITFPAGGLLLDPSYRPRSGSPVIGTGTYIQGAKHYGGCAMNPNSPDIGAHRYFTARSTTTRSTTTRSTTERDTALNRERVPA